MVVGVGVRVTVGVRVGVRVIVGVGVSVTVGVTVGVSVTVGVGVIVKVGDGVGVKVGVGVTVMVGDGVIQNPVVMLLPTFIERDVKAAYTAAMLNSKVRPYITVNRNNLSENLNFILYGI